MIGLMVFVNRFETSGEQVYMISQTIRKRRPCSLLVFGLGFDSSFYSSINSGGRTVFLEDNGDWFRDVTTRHPHLEAYLIRYKTKLSDKEIYLKQRESFATELPEVVASTSWDIIFVDAPAGYDDKTPGRMESLRLASILVKHPGDVFVHDCEREVEATYAAHFLKPENLAAEVANLRHYVISVTSA